MLLAAVGWSVFAGLLARVLLAQPRPGIAVSLAGGVAGWMAGFAADRLLELHALHPFRADGLLPATAIAYVILALLRRRRLRRSGRERTIFFES